MLTPPPPPYRPRSGSLMLGIVVLGLGLLGAGAVVAWLVLHAEPKPPEERPGYASFATVCRRCNRMVTVDAADSVELKNAVTLTPGGKVNPKALAEVDAINDTKQSPPAMHEDAYVHHSVDQLVRCRECKDYFYLRVTAK